MDESRHRHDFLDFAHPVVEDRSTATRTEIRVTYHSVLDETLRLVAVVED